MSHMIVEIDGAVSPSDEVILYSNEMRIDEFTAKGVSQLRTAGRTELSIFEKGDFK